MNSWSPSPSPKMKILLNHYFDDDNKQKEIYCFQTICLMEGKSFN